MTEKRRVKVWGKMNLYETSVVGIPAYPDAHASTQSFSLIKAVSNASFKPKPVDAEKAEIGQVGFVEEMAKIDENQLNLKGEEKTMSEENVQAEKSESPVIEKSVVETEKAVAMDASMITKMIKEGIQEGLKEMEAERGLVSKEKEKSPADLVKEMSTGELAICLLKQIK